MQIDMNQFREVFFEEVAEHVTNMEAALLQLEEAPQNRELLHGIFRGAHSIKGASSTFGFSAVARFTHVMESLLDQMRDGKIAPTPALTDLLLHSTDVLKGLVAAAKTEGDPPPAMELMIGELEQALAQSGTAPAASTANPQHSAPDPQPLHYLVRFIPGHDLLRQGMEPVLLLRDLSELGEVIEIHPDLSRLPALSHLDPESCFLSWTLRLRTNRSPAEIRDVFAFVEDDSEIAIEEWGVQRSESRPQTPPADPQCVIRNASSAIVHPQHLTAHTHQPAPESSSIRVPTDKVDKLINLVGELVITQSMITQMVEHFSPSLLHRLQEAVTEMERNTRELQERVMAVRMLPIGNTFSRFPRLVRDLAATLNKKITVQMIGEETELDKGVIERIGDPLTHLVRNAVDHGVDTPAERQQAGKPEQAVITLRAFHQGGSVIIEVADDGRGLNTEKIRQKGVAQGLISPDENLSDEQIHHLIFHPGFSTAETVSDLSGRGVGMDVVRRNVEALNGSVSICSAAGRGARVRIKLPLTLAIIDGLSLLVGENVYILPLITIVESIRPHPEHVKLVLGQGEVVVVRGEFLPLLRLHRLFDIPTRVTDPRQGLVVIMENEGRKLGLLVDELLGQSQVVIKNLEANYRKVEGVMGATIMGDGRVALILDVQGLSRLAAQTA